MDNVQRSTPVKMIINFLPAGENICILCHVEIKVSNKKFRLLKNGSFTNHGINLVNSGLADLSLDRDLRCIYIFPEK